MGTALVLRDSLLAAGGPACFHPGPQATNTLDMADKEHTDPERMEKIVSLAKRRGFIYQSAELYGGLNGCWDYGPLGTELKRNLKEYWWRKNVQGHTNDRADECPCFSGRRWRSD